jgi:hypothetical protein
MGLMRVKVYRVDDRRRAEREWLSLTFLSGHQAGSAPAPLWGALTHSDGRPSGLTLLTGRPFPETGDREGPLYPPHHPHLDTGHQESPPRRADPRPPADPRPGGHVCFRVGLAVGQKSSLYFGYGFSFVG